MNEFDFENNLIDDEDEIKRIQREIDKDLSSSVPEPLSEPIVMPQSEPVTVVYEPTQEITAPELKMESLKEELLIKEPLIKEPSSTDPVKEIFYTETVKNEKAKYKKNHFKKVVALVCAASVLGGSALGLTIGAGSMIARDVIIPRMTGKEPADTKGFSFNENAPTNVSVAPNAYTIIDNFSAIVDFVEPSVVGITSVKTGAESYFFNIPQEQENKGSGIIFDEDSEKVYIITNYHVIEGANNVAISIQGSEVVSAKLIGYESSSDLAVISVSKADLTKIGINSVTCAKFGTSEDLKVGEVVLAIGNALGEGNTATMGIVSANNKEVTIDNKTLTVIQTDAAINPGNSGGPLINTKGEVIGINTAKLASSLVEGTGYSITVDVAKPIIEDLRNQKQKPFLGIGMTDLDEETASMFNLPTMGVLVQEVYTGSAAEKHGILRGDVITGFNGKPVLNMEALSAYVKECEVGDEVEIKLYRYDVGSMTINAKLTARPTGDTF